MIDLPCCSSPECSRPDEANPDVNTVGYLEATDISGFAATKPGWYFLGMDRFGEDTAVEISHSYNYILGFAVYT